MNKELHDTINHVTTSTDYKVKYTERGNFTFCSVVDLRKGLSYHGFAKRNPVDPFVLERGRTIALARAIREMP